MVTKTNKASWIAVFATFLGFSLLCLFWKGLIQNHVQHIILSLLALDYIFQVQNPDDNSFKTVTGYAGISFMAFTATYFRLELSKFWLILPFVVVTLLFLVNRWPSLIRNQHAYFCKAGTLLTLLLMAEPIALGVQQNLKPIATIPIDSIFNQRNFVLLGVLLLLVLGGFLWKETRTAGFCKKT
ncbi:MAG: hypothetical protein AAGA86_07285 [Bacteroidota bacterium]